jgi:hypothetical protein
VDALPDGALRVPAEGCIVLPFGEVAGHAHTVDANHAEEYVSSDSHGERRHLRVLKPASLMHEAHAAVSLSPGIYEIVRLRKYAPGDISPAAG